MMFVADIPRAPTFEFNERLPQTVTTADYSGRRPPSEEIFYDSEFDLHLIPLEGGNQMLRLRKPIVLRINPQTLRFAVVDWDIELDCAMLSHAPREMARHFLRLWNSAESESLGEQDQARWLRITEYVDFQQFSIDRSLPHYAQGTLRSDTDLFVVEWDTGEREKLSRTVARALSEVNIGERFSAFVKLGKENKTLSMERVCPLENPKESEDWESWPTKN
jgi:hypothetical protein